MEQNAPHAVVLSGELNPEAIEQVFEQVRSSSLACRLRIWDERDEKVFLFTTKGVRLFHYGARRTDRLGQILVQHGKLTPSNLDELLALSKANGKPIGEAGVELGILTEHDIAAATHQQMEVHLSDLYFWKDARFDLIEGEAAPPDGEGLREFAIFGEPAEVFEGAAWRYRRWQSVRSVIRSEFQVFVRTELDEEDSAEAADDAASRILSFVDGTRQVRDIVRDSNVSALRVYEVLRNALIEGQIQKQGEVVLRTQTRRDELLDEIRGLENDRKDRPYDAVLLSRVSDRYLALGEKDLAAKRLRELARAQLRSGAEEEALQSLQRASQCVPQDYDIREQILDVYSGLGWERKLVEEGCELGNLYFKRNLLDRGRSLLGHLVYLAPREPRIRKLYALTLLGLGQKQLALWQWNELVKVLEQGGASDGERREVYRQILALDRKNSEIRRKLASLGREGRGAWLRRIAIGAAATLVLGVSALLYFERAAAGDALVDPHKIEMLARENRFEEAREALDLARRGATTPIVQAQLDETEAFLGSLESEYLAMGVASDVMLAERLEEEGEIDRAARIYERVARLDPGKHELVDVARRRHEELAEAEKIANDRIAYGRELIARDQRRDAHQVFTDAIRRYPHADGVSEIRIPLRIRTVPADAEVLVDGVRVADSTPAEVDYHVGPERRLVVRRPGFEDMVVPLDEPLPAEGTWSLQKRVRWTFRAHGPIDATPVVDGDVVSIGGRDRRLYAIRVSDGSRLRSAPLGVAGDVEGGPVLAGDRVLVGTAGGEVVALESASFRELWRSDLDRVAVTGLVTDEERGRAYAVREDGHVVALDLANGERAWEISAAASPDRPPVLSPSGRILVTSRSERSLVCLEPKDGSRAWDLELDGRPSTGLERLGDSVLLGCSDGILLVLGAEIGGEILRHEHSSAIRPHPSITEDRLTFGAADGSVRSIDRKSGSEVFQVSAQGGLPVGVAQAGDEIYVTWSGGSLQCIDRATGDTLWLRRTQAGIAVPPVLAGDLVLVCTLDGRVLAVER